MKFIFSFWMSDAEKCEHLDAFCMVAMCGEEGRNPAKFIKSVLPQIRRPKKPHQREKNFAMSEKNRIFAK